MRDRIAETVSAISRLATRRSEARRASDFRDRAEALRKPAEQLKALCERYRLLNEHGVPVSVKTGTQRSLLGQLAELRANYETDPESILAPDQKRFNTFWKPLETCGNQVESDLQNAWTRWVDDALPGGQQELLAVLEKFGSFRDSVQVIRGGMVEAGKLSAKLPAADVDFEAVANVAKRMVQAWDRLNDAHVSPEVMTFLKKAAAREATLADYTPDVLNWVKENDLFRSFLITVGGK